MNMHNAEEDRANRRGNPTCQGTSRLSEARGLYQWDCHQNVWSDPISVWSSVTGLGSSGAPNFERTRGLRRDYPYSFSTAPGGVAL